MPFDRVTFGDIGTNAEAVEEYLNTVLHLGKTCNRVLLLDEADVCFGGAGDVMDPIC